MATFLADGTALEDVAVGLSLDGSANPVMINVKAATGAVATQPPPSPMGVGAH